MVNKKLIALLVAISTVSASFGFLDDVVEGTGKVVRGTVDTATSVPRTAVTGETPRERAARKQREYEAERNAEQQRRHPRQGSTGYINEDND